MSKKVAVRRYSQAFKQQVVREYEAGASAYELRRKYGIGGGSTISGWVKRYGREGTRHQLMVIQKPEERNQITVCQARIADLEKAVAQLTLDKLMLEASLAEAEARLGEPVKKKGAARSSSVPADKTRLNTGGSR